MPDHRLRLARNGRPPEPNWPARVEYAELGEKVTDQRRRLPWVPVEKEYVFDRGRQEDALRLFDGRSQLLAYNIMFGPDYESVPVPAARTSGTSSAPARPPKPP